ncbi:MAG TPA: hypothetical protein VFV13_11710 [Acidimicrobiia bacterium]|nr:hypothetical protein [Acidimicrobiia bacterium]
MKALIAASAGLAIAGTPGALLGVCFALGFHVLRRLRRAPSALRPALIVLLIELRSGRSVLGALQTVAAAFPGNEELARAARVATISGLTNAVLPMRGELRGILSQLARAQKSGAALGDTVRAMIEADVADEKATRVARSRALPVRLMLPITLLVLPGLVLLLYAPSMLYLFEDLSGPFS